MKPPTVKAIVGISTWIAERIEAHGKKNDWPDEIITWGECLSGIHFGKRNDGLYSEHHTDPPPPVGSGFVGQIAVNYKNIDFRWTKAVGISLHFMCPNQSGNRICDPIKPILPSITEVTGKFAEIAKDARKIEALEAAQTQG